MGLLAGATVAGCVLSASPYDDAVAAPRAAKVAARTRVANARLDAAAGESADADPVLSGPLSVGVTDAILLALENNRGLAVQRLSVAKSSTREAELVASFDPKLTAGLSAGEDLSRFTREETESEAASLGVSATLPTGTTVAAEFNRGRSDPSVFSGTDNAGYGFNVKQALLRNGSVAANLAVVRQAALDVRATEYELRGFVESLVAQVEAAYWDYALAKRQIEIYETALALAKKQRADTEVKIQVGVAAELDLEALKAEVASREEALTGAKGAMESSRIRLLRLTSQVSPKSSGGEMMWERRIELREEPTVPAGDLEPVAAHVKNAMSARSDLNQARLAVRRGELEVVRTRNGLLPRLDAFVNLGRTGYANSFADAIDALPDGSETTSVGLNFEWTIGRRAAKAVHRRAELTRNEAELSLGNMRQLVQVDVRTAYISAQTARQQIPATRASQAAKKASMDAEIEKNEAGSSTTFLVAIARNEYVASQIAEVQAIVNYRKALVELYRADGSLLKRRGVSAPGTAPVK
jgi:outer membrane protein TolC